MSSLEGHFCNDCGCGMDHGCVCGWCGTEYEHLPMPINAQGQGPETDSALVARTVCWSCFDEDWPCGPHLVNNILERKARDQTP